ncbi:L,D-transpeptidase [Legionella yabuuchiae]|uniref:L,D-transpeptidase n=1 Tax=Legionella yabuuchiae TaxID=376727 RepID=UPI001056C5C8|nr:L,D-transpeptidase [Legionella yabuuchiae]
MSNKQLIVVDSKRQTMACYEDDRLWRSYLVSTGKNGMGELKNSYCTPRGWHRVHSIIGLRHAENSVFVAREWTGEIYSSELGQTYPDRDWILTRIIQLDGMEPGRNKGGEVDSLERYIYLHGTPDNTILGQPGSKGCIRMRNKDIIQLANWVQTDASVYIE